MSYHDYFKRRLTRSLDPNLYPYETGSLNGMYLFISKTRFTMPTKTLLVNAYPEFVL